MTTFKQYAGLVCIVSGTLVLLSTRHHALAIHNSLLLAGLLLIVAGIGIHLWTIKRESKY